MCLQRSLDAILALFLRVQDQNQQQNHQTDPPERHHTHQDELARRHEQLRLPLFRLVDRTRNDDHLGVGDELGPGARVVRQADGERVDKVGRATEAEGGVREMEREVSGLGELGGGAVLRVAVLGGGVVLDARTGQVGSCGGRDVKILQIMF